MINTIIGAFDQDLRPHSLEQFKRRVFLEDDDHVDRFKPRQHLRARFLALHRAAFTLEPFDRGVAVEPDDKPIAGATRLGQQPDVAGMQEVKASVGKADAQALPAPVIEAIRRTLAGEVLIPAAEALTIERSWPHGHVAAALGTARKLGLEALLDPQPSRQRDLVLAMVVGRILQPASKLATTRLLPTTSLGPLLDVEQATEDELYGAMDWLLARQEQIEQRLAKRYLKNGDVVLYDLSSTYVEGEHCPLAKRGYSRDGKPGKLQVEFGLLTNAEGAPLAIEAFAGNTADPRTFMGQVEKVKERFRVDEVVWVAGRGMLTGAQLAKLQEVAGNHWVTALRPRPSSSSSKPGPSSSRCLTRRTWPR